MNFIKKVNRIHKRIVKDAFANSNSSYSFVKQYAQEMEDDVIQKHINLYVNNFTVDLRESGKSAVSQLFEKAKEEKVFEIIPKDIFVE